MASIRKTSWSNKAKKSGTAWVVDYTDQDGVRRTKNFGTRFEAEDFKHEVEDKKRKGQPFHFNKDSTIKDAALRWLEDEKKRTLGSGKTLEPHTYRTYESYVYNHIIDKYGSKKLCQVGSKFVDDFISGLSVDLTVSTKSKLLFLLKAIFDKACIQGMMQFNHAKGAKIKTGGKRYKKKPFVPEQGSVTVLLKTAQNMANGIFKKKGRGFGEYQRKQMQKAWQKWEVLVFVLFELGIRMSEVRGLPWINIDFEARTVLISQRADENGIVGFTKSSDSYRTLEISMKLADLLCNWKEKQGEGRTFVFGTQNDRPDFLGNIVSRCWEPLLAEAGLSGITRHAMRHYRASVLIEKGWNPLAVQKFLGHESVEFTMNEYAHLFDKYWEQKRKEGAAESDDFYRQL